MYRSPLAGEVGVEARDEGRRRLASEVVYRLQEQPLTDGTSVWVAELTVYSGGGYIPYNGHDPAARINRAWDLRRSWFLLEPQRGWRGAYARALHRRLGREAHSAAPLPPQP